MRATRFLKAVIGTLLIVVSTPLNAVTAEGGKIVTSRCVSCHNIAGPAATTFEGVLQKKAPDLYYAGSKFNRPWLVQWLQKPTVIRRAGVMFLNHVINEGGKDMVRSDSIKPCPANLSPEEGEAVANYLMTLTDSAMKTGIINPAKKFRKSKARRLFTKQLPCIACHRARFGKRTNGGISGPDLTEAGNRLNPDWVYARIEDPQYWDPKTWMPKFELSHRKRELLTLFVSSMR